MLACQETPTTVIQHLTLARASIAKDTSVAGVVDKLQLHTLLNTCKMTHSRSKGSPCFKAAELLYGTEANLLRAE